MGGIGLHVLFFEGIGVNAMGTQSTLGSGAVHKWREAKWDVISNWYRVLSDQTIDRPHLVKKRTIMTMVDIDYNLPKNEETLQKLEEKAAKAQEAFEKEEKLRKELEVLNSKLLSEKTELLGKLEGEKGSFSEQQEKANKLAAQKGDLEQQLTVSTNIFQFIIHETKFRK